MHRIFADRPSPPPSRPPASPRRPRSGQTRPVPAPRRGGRVWPLVLLLPALGLAGCQPAKPTTGPSPNRRHHRRPGDTTAANPVLTARDAAIAAYRGMWAAYENASATANADEPSLSTYATGDALSVLQNGLRQMRADDQVARGTIVLHPTVVAVAPADAPTEISLTDCADTTASVLYHRDGGPVNDTPGGWRRVTATVTATAGTWKVASFGVRAVGSCTGP